MIALDPKLSRRLAQTIDDAKPQESIHWGDVVPMTRDLGVPVTRQWLSRCDLISRAYYRHREAHASPTRGEGGGGPR